MKRWLLDANVISELRKFPRCHPGVEQWRSQVVGSPSFLSVVTIGEIWKGVDSLKKRDPERALILETWCNKMEADYRNLGRLLEVDARISRRWGEFQNIRSLPRLDAFLAATAHVHDLVIATRNMRDFEGLPVEVENPWETPHPPTA